ncbi:MAG: pseudouridine-5'-phosphate glycosidase [Planctomycetota bacterium]|jgi:pseudouridine-5'-phosphate glycosidase
MTASVRVHPEVAEALHERRAVVALETAVVTTGLPAKPIPRESRPELSGWNDSAPAHLEAARMMQRAVRDGGAVPATVAVLEGVLRIGLEPPELEQLADTALGEKSGETDLAYVLAGGHSAGTTVSATLAACRLAEPAPIRVFATGGIGGVHRHWTRTPDVSNDLTALARTACCVVCTGAKSILDGVATLELLETLGVAVTGFGCSCWPRFVTAPDPDLHVPRRLDEPAAVGRLCRVRWSELQNVAAVLVAVPLEPSLTIEAERFERWLDEAESEAVGAGVEGARRTPFLLGELARRSAGRTLRANIALLHRNATVATMIARELASSPGREEP